MMDRYIFFVIRKLCRGKSCRLCEHPARLPGLITRYSGKGLVTGRYFSEPICKQRLDAAIAACPAQAIRMEEMR